MNRIRTTIIAALTAAVAVLGACTTVPTADQVDQIQLACSADATARPIIDALVAVPGLATAAESEGIAAAHLAIDQICSNPASAPATNGLAILTAASGKITALIVTLQVRKGATASAS